MPRGSILVVDDDDAVRVTLGAVLIGEGYDVTLSANGLDALARLRMTEFDVILTDLRLDHIDGLRILEEARSRWPDTVALMLTGFASVDSAINALRKGAYDYLCKPCPPEELVAVVARAVERRRLSLQVRHHARDLETAIGTARELHSALFTRLEGTTALLREREQVLVTICTDLKTSLIAIAGVAQLLIGHVQDRDHEHDLVGYLEQIRSETQQLAQRVNAALQVTRTESVAPVHATGPGALSQVSLESLVVAMTPPT
jgi:DNA-binding response OmpR family regulator